MIHAAPGAPLGTLVYLPAYGPPDFPRASVVLCRNCAPLISLAYGFAMRGIAVRVAGKEIGVQLEALIKRMKTGNVQELQVRLRDYLTSAPPRRQERVSDEVGALLSLCEAADDIAHVLSRIRRIFDDKQDAHLLLSTIHKAKGKEWTDVFILDFGLIPSKYATTPAELQQEKNLQYVAVTRSLANLTYIQSNSWTI